MKETIIPLLFFFLTIASSVSKVPHEVIIAGDQWCPYVCDSKEKRGFSVELVEKALKIHSIKTAYTNSSFLRLVKNIEKGHWHVVTGTNESFTPNLLISKEPVAYTKWVFVTRKESNWKYSGADSLKEITLGTVGGYVYSKKTTEYINSHSNKGRVSSIFSLNPQKVNLQKLILGRIDVFLGEESVISYWADQLDIAGKIKIAGVDLITPLYCGLPQSQTELKELLDKGIQQFIQTDEFQKLRRKYRIQNWMSY